MSGSSHKHKVCGGDIWTEHEADLVRCDKCKRGWALSFFHGAKLAFWEREFEGYHPERERINNEEILVEVQVGKTAFLSMRKRGSLNQDGTLNGEEGVWRKPTGV